MTWAIRPAAPGGAQGQPRDQPAPLPTHPEKGPTPHLRPATRLWHAAADSIPSAARRADFRRAPDPTSKPGRLTPSATCTPLGRPRQSKHAQQHPENHPAARLQTQSPTGTTQGHLSPRGHLQGDTHHLTPKPPQQHHPRLEKYLEFVCRSQTQCVPPPGHPPLGGCAPGGKTQ